MSPANPDQEEEEVIKLRLGIISLLSPALALLNFWFLQPPVWAQSGGVPSLVLKQQIHDFKEVTEGQFLEHTFDVANQGDAPLTIERVKPDCSCSVAHFDPVIAPKGEGKITVKIDTRGFDGPERWTVKVFSNDPKWNEALLDLRANVKAVLTLSGTAVLFTGKRSRATTREIEISTGLDRPLTLTPQEFSLSGKVIYSLSEIEKGKRYKVAFQNVAGPRENYRGFLKLKTNFPEKPEVTLWIVGRFDE